MSGLPEKFLYFFSEQRTDGHAGMKDILGGKGAGLAEMSNLNIPVPPGFTISTEICRAYYENKKILPSEVKAQVTKALSDIKEMTGKSFGDEQNPLLLSVRSGARVSMPGMMDTILNLGLNDKTVEGLSGASGNAFFAYDSYRRFIQMYANVVMHVNYSKLEIIMEDLQTQRGDDFNVEDLKSIVDQFKSEILGETGRNFPDDPYEQLFSAISSVFESWNTPRAKTYRRLHDYSQNWGTAVNVQAMVFGNLGDESATGVAFTRQPSTGQKAFFGEYLLNAQGEDVVAGLRTPQPLTENLVRNSNQISLEKLMPDIYAKLLEIAQKLENHYRDMQDLEFTVEDNQLWLLQTRSGKRTAQAGLKIAMDMMNEKLISEEEVLLRIDPISLDKLLHPTLASDIPLESIIAQGLPASPGATVGKIVFQSQEAEDMKMQGENVILVRLETSPEDIHGMIASSGILTARGGMTSHAAVVARGMGKPCIVGCGELEVNETQKTLKVGGHLLKLGDVITIDGTSGKVLKGEAKTDPPRLTGEFQKLMNLADKYRKLRVRSNVDTPCDAKLARQFGGEGIGLCRTEHMFFDPRRIDVVRRMILADSLSEREDALSELQPIQKADFMALLCEMKDLPVTIRLLDPPLHEFLPQTADQIESLAKRLHIDEKKLHLRMQNLKETNPMLGHRGCRLAITYPEIYKMQTRAIAEAVADLINRYDPQNDFKKMARDKKTLVEIMIPLASTKKEIDMIKKEINNEVLSVQQDKNVSFAFLIGTMIELPRAAITADEIALSVDFFSFGTNDLTQTTLGLSRDDAALFLENYVALQIYEQDPFVSIDQKGVGSLMKLAVELGRKSNPNLKLGICGEHGGDPRSIEFFHKLGLDYVSCSPYRIPIAKLAAAKAACC